MRIGIYGGTFDPVHMAHLILAEQCREQCQLDEVWFVPAAIPPHKQGRIISDSKTRVEMLELAISGHPGFRICRLELDRSGPSYTVTTLEQIHQQIPAAELFLLMGADSIRELPDWREPGRILQLATVVAVNRGRDSLMSGESLAAMEKLGSERFMQVQMPGIDIAATDIRQRASLGHSLRYLVPRAVEVYIQEHGVFANRQSSTSLPAP